MDIQKNRYIYLTAHKILGRHPKWSEYEHLSDLYEEINIQNVHLGVNGKVFCDVTQLLKQTRITGIQRVVMSFRETNVTNFVPIFFQDGNFHYCRNEIEGKKGYFSRHGTEIVNKCKLVMLRFGFLIWTKYITRVVSRNNSLFSGLSTTLKIIRDKLLPVTTADNQLSVEDMIQGRLFIPDLPADRSHLEALLILAMRGITPIDLYVHDAIPLTFPELMPKGSTNEFNLYLKLVAHASRIFCSSDTVKKDIEKIITIFPIDPDRSTHICIYPFPIISQTSDEPKLSKKEANILKEIEDSNVQFVYAVGTILVRKNYSLIIRALDHLSRLGIESNFYIFAHHNWGDDSFEMSLTPENKRKVKIIEGASDALVRQVSKKSIALVFPSLIEGYGLPITEAFSNGIHVIVNNVEPMNKFADLSRLVHVADFNSSLDWAQKIRDIIENRRVDEDLQVASSQTWDGWAQEFILKNLT